MRYRGQLGRAVMYTLFASGLAYAGADLYADTENCCNYDNDCTDSVCCPPTSPLGCSKDKFNRCLVGCQDIYNNWFCPGASECKPPL